MTKYSAIICSMIYALFLSSCEQDEQIPAYLSINSISLSSNYASQGTASHNIKDAWIYIDGQIQGVYELPARFPVLAEGTHAVSIAAGIFDDGISATRTKYPFYDFYDTIINFTPGQTLSLPSPIPVKYFDALTYTWYEDFEGTGFTFASTPTSDAELVIENTDVYEGAHSSKFILTGDDPVFSGQMQDGYPIVTQDKTYLELNFKTEQPFAVGLTVNSSVSSKNVYVATVNKSDSWNKIYIDLSKVVNENQSSSTVFRVYIYAALDAGRSQSVVYLDNLKLLHN